VGFQSEYLDLALSVAVVFFLASLIVSGMHEGLAWITRIRAKFLWAWLHDQLNPPPKDDGEPNDDKKHKRNLPKLRRGFFQFLWHGGDSLPRSSVAAGTASRQPADQEMTERLLAALEPLEVATKPGSKTRIKSIPTSSLVQALLEVFSDVGKRELAADLSGLLSGQPRAAERLGDLLAKTPADRTAVIALFTAYAAGVIGKSQAEVESAADAAANALAALPGAQPEQTLRETLFAFGWSAQSGAAQAAVDAAAAAAAAKAAADAAPDDADQGAAAAAAKAAADAARAAADAPAAAVISSLSRMFPDVLVRQRFEGALARLDGTPIAPTLKRLWDTSMRQMDNFRVQFEHWVDGEYSRLSGFYKRWIRWFMAVFAIVVAAGLNVDAIGLTTSLWRNPGGRTDLVALADQVAAEAGAPTTTVSPPTTTPGATTTTTVGSDLDRLRAVCVAQAPPPSTDDPTGRDAADGVIAVKNCVTDNFNKLTGLGVVDRSILVKPSDWWKDFDLFTAGQSWWTWLQHLVGVVLTALALFMGAPFWFDIIKRLTGVRKGLTGRT
jgi:hypothetical protein